ncbi:hypothetical protein IWW34DRAFT_797066 [Fusarium oxysporum f. sp. albedinis]|nr:hypothetical protein IWW34DRAFT_797066 [Fusarium oxysporum f. sp. albedinis]
MPFNLFKDASPPTGEGHSIWKRSYPPASFIQPLGQSKPLIPRKETLVVSHKQGLPPPPLLDDNTSRRPKQAHQQPPKPPAARSCDPMTEMLENIGLLLTDYECTDQQAWNPRTTVLLRRVPGDGLWLKCRRNAEAIMLTHNFDSVYVLTLDLMHRPFGKRYIRPILLAESHSHHEHAQDINLLVPITMYSDLINTRCWKKHEVTDLPPGFECGFSRVLNQPTVSGEENESQPVIIVGIDMYILAMTILLPATNASNLGQLSGMIFAKYEI